MNPSVTALSAAAVISGADVEPSANQVVLHRAQRTERPAAPSEAGSIAYDVEQFGQTISMVLAVFRVAKRTSRPLMDRKP